MTYKGWYVIKPNKPNQTNRIILYLEVSFGLVSLFNGISTFVGYLMPKLFSLKNSSGFIHFPRVFARKWT